MMTVINNRKFQQTNRIVKSANCKLELKILPTEPRGKKRWQGVSMEPQIWRWHYTQTLNWNNRMSINGWKDRQSCVPTQQNTYPSQEKKITNMSYSLKMSKSQKHYTNWNKLDLEI